MRRHVKASTAEPNQRLGRRRLAQLATTLALVFAVGAQSAFAALPDNRAWEMVSPVDKNASDVSLRQGVAAIGGGRFAFVSPGSFAGAPTAQAGGISYLSARTAAGWTTKSIAMPGGELFPSPALGYRAFTADLSKGVQGWPENSSFGTYDPQAQIGLNLYLGDFEAGSFQLLNGTLASFSGDFAWGSSDLSTVAFASTKALTADSPCTPNAGICVYESDNGVLRLASVGPGDEPMLGFPGGGLLFQIGNVDNVVSDDGSRLFFSSESQDELYVRENGSSTTLISGSERTLPGGVSGRKIHYQGAEAAHGDRVIFTTENSLVDGDDDETNDLYRYDFAAPAGERLTLISADQNPSAPAGADVNGGEGDSGGVLARSDDLRRVYFVADNQILPGEPEDAGPKLYLWDDTGAQPSTTYIGALDAGDYRAWQGSSTVFFGGAAMRRARWSANGRFMAFVSAAKLTAFDNEGASEIYRYDAVSDSLVCASCAADSFPTSGYIGFNRDISEGELAAGLGPANHLPKNVSDTGQVFFETARGLVTKDSNGKTDVYEYADGDIQLISGGNGSDVSVFLDATPTGSDVFFATLDQLVGWDEDNNFDAYDARVGGGFPEPPLQPPACEGDACQPAPVAPNDPTPASSSFQGAGNVSSERAARRCKRGKVRRQGRCRSKRRAAHVKQGKPNKNATRSHG